MTVDEATDGARALGLVEGALYRIGGVALLDDARVEARWYADLYHPWAGTGDEPPARLAARIGILCRRAERGAPRPEPVAG